MQKVWSVGRTGALDFGGVAAETTLSEPVDVATPRGFTFLADPLPGGDGTVWCEALERSSGKGRVLVLSRGKEPVICDLPGVRAHCSYPFVVETGGHRYLIPEMAAAGPQRIFTLQGTRAERSKPLLGLEEFRVTDPTVLHHEGRWWLFGGIPGSAADLLWLWSAEELEGPFEPHPENPIVIDAARARPAGPLVTSQGRLFRLGQYNCGSYGDGVTIAEVVELTSARYREEVRGRVRIHGRKGPHTLFNDRDFSVVDSYVEHFNPWAWRERVRRQL